MIAEFYTLAFLTYWEAKVECLTG